MSKQIARAFAITQADIMLWKEWKSELRKQRYLEVSSDLTGFDDKKLTTTADFIGALDKLEFTECPPTVGQWLDEYEEFMKQDPPHGLLISTYEGEPVRINCELKPGSMPFLSAKIYVPKMTCSPIAWFAHGLSSRADFGWRAVLVPQAREEVIRKHIIRDNIAPVGALKVHGKSASGKCILVSIAQW